MDLMTDLQVQHSWLGDNVLQLAKELNQDTSTTQNEIQSLKTQIEQKDAQILAMRAVEKPKDVNPTTFQSQMPEIPLLDQPNAQKAEYTVWVNQVYAELCIQKKDNVHLKDNAELLKQQNEKLTS